MMSSSHVRSRFRLGRGVALVLAALLPTAAEAAVYYVGTGPTCGDGPNDRPSLGAALLSAAFTTADDEIRLTRTLSYTNIGLDLVDWHPGVAGRITIAGGFDNCDDAVPSGRIALAGQTGDSLLTVTTSSQPSSMVTLRALEMTGAEFRGVVVSQGGELALQNVWIHHNGGGALVAAGGSLAVDATSEITDHAPHYAEGGGIDCSGSGSYVSLSGKLRRNQVTAGGGSLYVGNGCVVEMFGGALLEGNGDFPGGDDSASYGGGVFVDNGTLVAHGGASQVVIRKHQVWGIGQGGGIFASGPSANVVLFNTRIEDNDARLSGAAIHAENGATVVMDRVAACPLVFSCSVLAGGRLIGGWYGMAVSVDDAVVSLRRTVVVDHGIASNSENVRLFHAAAGAQLELDGVLIARNQAVRLFESTGGSTVLGQYVTSALNSYTVGGSQVDPWVAIADGGTVGFYSSIFDDSKGFQALSGGAVDADCLLVDSATGLSAGTYWIGVPQFVNAAGGDLRQVAGSPGVDFCDEQLVPWPGSTDVELDPRGGDISGNPNGSPGIAGGLYDVGFSESPPSSNLIFVDGFESGNTGAWSSTTP